MSRIIALSGEKVSLVLPEKRDVDIMYRGINNIDILKYIGSTSFENEEEYLNEILKSGKIFFMIMLNETKEIIGSLGIHNYLVNDRNGEIGISLYDESKMGMGYGTESMGLLLKYCFEYRGFHKLYLYLFADNKRALKSYEKSGFKQVGYLKENKYFMGEYKDQIIMEILRSEYLKTGKN